MYFKNKDQFKKAKKKVKPKKQGRSDMTAHDSRGVKSRK